MKMTLLDNGLDSLKHAYNALEKVDELMEGVEHNLKDAILSINHAVEILIKLKLRRTNESLIFSDLEKYMKAKETTQHQQASNVLEVDPKLKTVTLNEAIRRLELLCDIHVPGNLKAAINYINQKRNMIMHYEIILTLKEQDDLTKKLKSCYEMSVDFFEQYVGGIKEGLKTARFEQTEEDYWNDEGEDSYDRMREDALIDHLEGAYEDLGEGKW